MDLQAFRKVFNSSQHLHKHQRCLKVLTQFYNEYYKSEDGNEFIEELMRELTIMLCCDPRSPFTKHALEFMAKFLLSLSKENDSSDNENIPPKANSSFANNNNSDNSQQSMDDSDDDSEPNNDNNNNNNNNNTHNISKELKLGHSNMTDVIMKILLVKHIYSLNNNCRYNSCILVRKVFTKLLDIDQDVYDKLKKALLDRCSDKERTIRSAAALALHRFQEGPKDLAVAALTFHLKNDPDFAVRQSCLQSLLPIKETIKEFVCATRDVKDIIRKTAYTLIGDKINIRLFNIEQRLVILKNGLNERSAAVKKTVETKLVPNWVKSFDGDVAKLLLALDIQTDPKLIEKMLFIYFDHIRNNSDDSGYTGFHKLMDDFRDVYLDKLKMITKVDITAESAFLWNTIAKYVHQNEITIPSDENSDAPASDDIEMVDENIDGRQIKVHALDTLLPDLPYYCAYISKFIEQVLHTVNEIEDESDREAQLMDYEFMFNQLLIMGLLIEVGDDSQRQILVKALSNILKKEQLVLKFNDDYISHIMKLLSVHVFAESNALLEFTIQIIDSIYTHCVNVEEQTIGLAQEHITNSQAVDAEQLRRFEFEYAKLTVEINDLRDQLDSAKSKDNFIEAQRVKVIIDELTNKRNDIMEKRLNVNCGDSLPSQSQTHSQTHTFSDFPVALELCAQIYSACLDLAGFKVINSIILNYTEKLVLQCITNLNINIRSIGIKCLGLTCMISLDSATTYFPLFLQILKCDSDIAQEYALKCIFDILCLYGLNCFEFKNEHKKDKQNNECDDDNDTITMMNEKNSKDNDETVVYEKSVTDEDDDESFIELLTDLLISNLQSDSENICLLTAQGIAKLFILGRMYSPQLLTKLVIEWYNPDSSEKMRQFLGVFLPVYSGVETKSTFNGQHAYEQCFVTAIEKVYNDGINYVNLDNLVNFLLELISDEGHSRLAHSIANRILTLTVKSELSTKYYLRILSCLRLDAMSQQDLKQFHTLVRKVDKLYKNNNSRVTSSRIATIQTKIVKQFEQIKFNSSQTEIFEDFGENNLSQTSNDSHIMSQFDETQ